MTHLFFEKKFILNYYNSNNKINWHFAKTRPSFVIVAMSEKPWNSHATHHVLTQRNTSWSKEETENMPTNKTWNKVSAFRFCNFFMKIQTINTLLGLFIVSWKIVAKHVNDRIVGTEQQLLSTFLKHHKTAANQIIPAFYSLSWQCYIHICNCLWILAHFRSGDHRF